MTHAINAIKRARAVRRVRASLAANRSAGVPQYSVDAMGLRFPNPIGLAAGFDRDGRLLQLLGRCGFGFVEIGTVTARPRPGAGRIAAAVRNLQRRRASGLDFLIGVNIGSASDGFDERVSADYAAAMSALWSLADYLVINLTSPRSPDRRRLDSAQCCGLLLRFAEQREFLARATGRRVPLTVKLSLDEASSALIEAVKSVRIAGVIGVSGNINAVRDAVVAFDPIPVISVGSVRNAADVSARLALGATLVQIYQAFVDGSPSLPRRIIADLRCESAAKAAEP